LLDVEDRVTESGYSPLVTQTQGDRVPGGKGLEPFGSIHASTVEIDLRERIGNALPISLTTLDYVGGVARPSRSSLPLFIAERIGQGLELVELVEVGEPAAAS
jgi:hypothetical protein